MSDQYAAFITPTLLDIRESLTVMGLSVKTKADSIGVYGTGLKYGVAVLARMEIPVEIWVGKECYRVEKVTKKAARTDQEYETVRLYHANDVIAETIDLPFTLNYGRNWELWQVFRELMSNTIDESGRVDVSPSPIRGQDGETRIVVKGPEMVAEYLGREKTFLRKEGWAILSKDNRVTVYDRPSHHIYFKGLRVFDLPKPAALTYDFQSGVDLSEDRMAKDSHALEYYIRGFLASCDDKEFIAKALQGDYEKTFNFSYDSHRKPSDAFVDAVMTTPHGNATTQTYLKAHAPKDPVERLSYQFQHWINNRMPQAYVDPESTALLKKVVETLESYDE